MATGGGTLTVSNTGNSITSTTGQLAQIVGMTISGLGVNFADINRTAAGATNAVLLRKQHWRARSRFGMTTDDDWRCRHHRRRPRRRHRDPANPPTCRLPGLRINNTNAVSGVRIEKFNANASTVNLSDMQINGGDIGVEVLGGGTGALTMSAQRHRHDRVDRRSASDFDNVDAGTIAVNNATVDGNSLAATAGIRIRNSNATFTYRSEHRDPRGRRHRFPRRRRHRHDQHERRYHQLERGQRRRYDRPLRRDSKHLGRHGHAHAE